MSTLEKLMIVGVPGAGKTTLAKILGAELDLPVLHIDERFINSDGRYIPVEEMKEIALDICSEDKWIIDGMYRIIAESVINEADLLIFIDMGRVANIKNVMFRRTKSFFRSRYKNPDDYKKKIHLRLIKRVLRIIKQIWFNRKGYREEWYEIINSCINPAKLVRITKINKKSIKLIMEAVICKDNELY
ncbi:MAG: AAA family ATPase [Clostridiales bacterium]|nr:AAA family ATPase [Clostridiales bacterium]